MAGAVKAFSIVLRKSPEAAGVPGHVGSRWRVSGSATLLPLPSWSHGGCRGADITPPHVIQRQKEERPSARALVPLLLEEGFFSPQKSPTDERANACVLRSRPASLEGSPTQTPARAP